MFQDYGYMEVFKIFGTKVLYFTMLYELTKSEHFLLSEVAKILSMGLSDQYYSFLLLTVEELLLLNQENPYLMFN